MANPHKGEVEFTASGESYKLVYSTNALCELEDLTGRGFTDIILELQSWAPKFDEKGNPLPETQEQIEARAKKMRLSLVRAVFCAGLRDNHEKTTLKQAGDLMVSVGGLVPAMDLINRAFAVGFPDVEKQPHPPQPGSHQQAIPAGTGSAS